MVNTGSASCPFCEWYYGSAVWRRSCAQNILWAILAAVAATILIRSTIAPSAVPNWKAA